MTEGTKDGAQLRAPRVTVLMAVYNGFPYVREAVDSILAQTFLDFELLAVDDGSTDETLAILEGYSDPRVRVIRNVNNQGLTRSLNIGLEAARGELIARQDADDRSRPDRLRRQVEFLDANPAVVALGCQAGRLDASSRLTTLRGWSKLSGGAAIRWQLMFDSPFFHTAVMFRRAAVMELGGYDPLFPIRQDVELWSRLGARYELRNLPDVLVDFRTTAGSLSNRNDSEELARVEQVMLENRRRTLESEIGRDGLEEWLSVNNPTVGAVAKLQAFIYGEAKMFDRFCVLYPSAASDHEIRDYRATNLARVAGNGALQGSYGALLALWRGYRISPGIGLYWLGRYVWFRWRYMWSLRSKRLQT